MPGVRHIHPTQVESTLRRSGQIEQLLGISSQDASTRVVRWVTLCVVEGRVELRVHESQDVGSDEYADVASFPSADADDEYGEGRVVAADSNVSLLLAASIQLGARADRWVTQGVIADEYLDARSGRE
jgi:hypothetical protein